MDVSHEFLDHFILLLWIFNDFADRQLVLTEFHNLHIAGYTGEFYILVLVIDFYE